MKKENKTMQEEELQSCKNILSKKGNEGVAIAGSKVYWILHHNHLVEWSAKTCMSAISECKMISNKFRGTKKKIEISDKECNLKVAICELVLI